MSKIKLSELTPEQRRKLRTHAEKKVNRKMKSIEAQKRKEKKWADQMTATVEKVRQSDEGKVPVRLDPRTVVMVKKEKCILQEDGTWVKKPL